MEEWKNVVGYDGYYKVSSSGRVMRVKSPKGKPIERELKQSIAKTGYPVVGLSLMSKVKVWCVHRLMALAFFGEPPSNRHVVAHIDGNRKNNILSNLRWATPSENLFDCVLHGTNHGKYYGRKSAFSDEQISYIRSSNKSATELAKIYGVVTQTIYQIRSGETYRHLIDENYQDKKLYGVGGIKTKPKKVNEYIEHDDYIEIVLTQGQSTKISKGDFDKVRPYKWYAVKRRKGYWACAHSLLPDGTKKNISLHRLLLEPDEDHVVDHINMNPLDNRRENIRIASRSQNQMNRRVSSNNTTGYKGVSIDSRSGKFIASISVNCKFIRLGTFQTAEEAAKAYAEASRKYHGEYGRTHLDD